MRHRPQARGSDRLSESNTLQRTERRERIERGRASTQQPAEYEVRTKKGRATLTVEAGHQRAKASGNIMPRDQSMDKHEQSSGDEDDDAPNSAELAHHPQTPHSYVLPGLDARGGADLGSSIEEVASKYIDVYKAQHEIEGSRNCKRARTVVQALGTKSPVKMVTTNERAMSKVNL